MTLEYSKADLNLEIPTSVIEATHTYPDELPDGFCWKRVLEWTCPAHNRPPDPVYNEDGEECDDEWDWPVPGCTCDTSATWRPTDDWEVGRKPGAMLQMLKAYYLPAIQEQLNLPFSPPMREAVNDND